MADLLAVLAAKATMSYTLPLANFLAPLSQKICELEQEGSHIKFLQASHPYVPALFQALAPDLRRLR